MTTQHSRDKVDGLFANGSPGTAGILPALRPTFTYDARPLRRPDFAYDTRPSHQSRPRFRFVVPPSASRRSPKAPDHHGKETHWSSIGGGPGERRVAGTHHCLCDLPAAAPPPSPAAKGAGVVVGLPSVRSSSVESVSSVPTAPLVARNPIRFSTKPPAPTGLYYYGCRYYTPSQGRRLGRDPVDKLQHYLRLNIADIQETHRRTHPREKDEKRERED